MNRFRWWMVTGVAAFMSAATFSLGLWQLSRAHEREAQAAQALAQVRRPALTLDEALRSADRDGRRLHLRGRWLADATIFLDNRQRDGRPGFEMVTPLAVEGREAVVLVNRGWLPRNFQDRQALPAVPTPSGVVDVVGVIVPHLPRLYELGAPSTGPIRQNLDIAEFRGATHLPLVDFAVLQHEPAAHDGLRRDWPAASAGAERNYGYAVQWFALSALILVLYFGFQIVRTRTSRSQPRG